MQPRFFFLDTSDPRCRMKKCCLMMSTTSGRPLASKEFSCTHSVCVFVHPSVVEVKHLFRCISPHHCVMYLKLMCLYI